MSRLRYIELDEYQTGTATRGERFAGRGGRVGRDTSLVIVETAAHPRGGQRLVVETDTGKRYVVVLRERLHEGMCDCGEWKFRGARAGHAAGLPHGQRLACKHISVVHRATVASGNPPGPAFVAPRGRLAYLEF